MGHLFGQLLCYENIDKKNHLYFPSRPFALERQANIVDITQNVETNGYYQCFLCVFHHEELNQIT